ncbi:UbiH/UbiF/VisC/COQ6 family ubiquinone biosynthesis hydroxylase [Sphingomonas sp. 35-24ZXX]|uniref:UbiH/UbiF/VisC/COQ6 family ubiquinone biosynthesis hydroxylase n=1 Tax=Sphingomonas sp. 35-24ZXX TaxID=1545915 RepID=UPI00053BE694|nr:UbiH/UbiF/VisC/COQ6 family ubiquinone biosynthesis hydroxylase [Sphingomonas sp. 35-24ZXX]
MTQIHHSDILIMGAGPVGLSLALAAVRHGLSVRVIDRITPQTLADTAFDGRASALASTSWQMLQNLGLGDRLWRDVCPIDRIAVSDGLRQGALDFDAGVDGMGVMLPNSLLRAALYETASADGDIDLVMAASVTDRTVDAHRATVTLADGRTFTASLLVGAEGRVSPTRDLAGITLSQWSYRQRGIVTAVTLEKSHQNTAFEIFYPDGPLAVLPLNDDDDGRPMASIVWTVPEGKADAWTSLSDRAFGAALTRASGGFLGEMTPIAPRSSWPLTLCQASDMVAPRISLIGDSAHIIHPIAGQGLNLGLRDVAALADVLGEGARLGLDPGDLAQLQRYQSWRMLDNMMMAAATDVLNRLYGLPGGTPSLVRRVGMQLVGRTGLIRRLIVDEARGTSGDLPQLLMASD